MSRHVGKNAIFNVLGALLPALIGLIVMPIFLKNIGADRLGVLTLAFGIMGFAGIFDLGISRGLTQAVAAYAGRGYSLLSISLLIRKTLPVIFGVGVFWCLLLIVFSNVIVGRVFHISNEWAEEVRVGIGFLAISLPIVVISSGLMGALEGMQNFGLVNLIRMPASILVFLVPAFISYFTNDIGLIIASLTVIRLIFLIFWLVAVCSVFPDFLQGSKQKLELPPMNHMWKFTGWLTVSNVVGPIMVQADRFYLASLFTPAAVAYYAVPLDILSRATAFPQLAMNAAFPALARAGVNSDEAKKMLRWATLLMSILWVIPLLIFSLCLHWFLIRWLGASFAEKSLEIAGWIMLGVCVNGYAHIPYAFLQSEGRSDLTAKLHIIELPFYVCVLIISVAEWGVLGAAKAWSFRVAFDAFLLYFVAYYKYTDRRFDFAIGFISVISSILIFLLFVI